MTRTSRKSRRDSGLTLLELALTTGMVGVFLSGVFSATFGVQKAFLQGEELSELALRARNAMERVVAVSGQAVTGDALYSALRPSTGVDSHCLRFRLIQSIDTATGQPIYDDNLRVYIYGPDSGTNPCQGLIIGRGTDLAAIHSAAAGPDGFLGTRDDNTAAVSSGIPAVELLIPADHAPRTGDMFTVNSSPTGRLLTFTLRLNARGADGNLILPNDLVLTERVALRQ